VVKSPRLAPRPPKLRNSIPTLEERLGPIEYRPPTSLKKYENNPRKHSQKQIVQLMASMRQFGFPLPILVDNHGVIIAGEA
jgi:ParB-like chromosome segregation protein Spo0J